MDQVKLPIIEEADLSQLFQPRRFEANTTFFKSTLICLVIFAVLFITSNITAFWSIWNYQRPTDVIPPKINVQAKNELPAKEEPINPKTETSIENISLNNNTPEVDITDNELYIPSLNIKVPVSWQVGFEEDLIQKQLQNGVVNLAGTAQAGEIGNTVITGHSSYFSWAPGNYKSIFANLAKMKLNDKIYLMRANNLYVYTVKDIFEVTPDRVEVMSLGEKSQLTLITCVPVGTAQRRLIIQAEQTSPDPQENKPFSGQKINFGSEIPTTR